MNFNYMVSRGCPQMISTVCLEVQAILCSEEFHEELRKVGKINQSNLDGTTLSAEIKRVFSGPVRSITVALYSYPWYKAWLRSRVVAEVRARTPKTINLNTWFLEVNDDVDYSRTIGHESVHVVDGHSPYWFGHGDDDPSGDELTAPHIVGDLVAKFYALRRQRKLVIAHREGPGTLAETLVALGAHSGIAPGLAEFMLRENQSKGRVYDEGTEYGAPTKNSGHLVD